MIRFGFALWMLAGCHVVFGLDDLPPEDLDPFCADDGLRLCLDFEDSLADNQVTDGSSYQNHALVMNATHAPRGSRSGIEADPSIAIEIPDLDTHDLAGEMTIELWFGYSGPPTEFASLLDKDVQYGARLDPDRHAICVVTLDATFANVESRSDKVVSETEWHHLACVRTSVSLDIYLDGEPAGSKFFPTPVADTNTGIAFPMYLGRDGDAQDQVTTNPLTGYLDDVRIYNRALDAADIQKSFTDRR